jgi:ribosomal protein L7/L12
MPLTLTQAIEVAKRELERIARTPGSLVILSEATKEFDVGWVFYWISARHVETGNILYALAGNAPLFVSRSDGRVFVVSYHRPLLESLAAYRACGDPNAKETPEVCLVGWHKGALTVTAIQAIRQHTVVGLAQAKSAVDTCLTGRSSVVSVPSVTEARALVHDLEAAGFEAHVRFEGQPVGRQKARE